MHYPFGLFFTKALEDRAESHHFIRQEIEVQRVENDLEELDCLESSQAPS